MRWLVFFIFTFVLLTLEVGLRPLWALPIGPYHDAAPSLLLVLGIFISINASSGVVICAMLLLGALVDLTQPIGKLEPIREIVLLGPSALGFFLGGLLAMRLRTLVFRDSVITLVVMTFTVGLFIELATVLIIGARQLLPTDPIPDWHIASQLMQRAMSVIYSAIVAIALGLVLGRSRRAWQFYASRGSSMLG